MTSTRDTAAPAPTREAGPGDAGWVTARIGAAGFRTDVSAGAHSFVADEPRDVGGGDEGATPYDYLLAAVGACTAMTLRMYATRKGWPLDEAVIRFRTARSHAADCESCESRPVGVGRLERQVELRGPLTPEQRTRLLAIADRCPVKQTLERGLEFAASVEASVAASERRDADGGEERGRDRAPDRTREATPDEHVEELIDEASEESFPASDPPSWEPLHPGDPGEHGTQR
jgi:putative redox protein